MIKTLIFVYNAGSGLFNTVTDIAHKLFSPDTYPCNLCAITHSALGMKQEWKNFIEGLGIPVEFLHRNELSKYPDFLTLTLPAILIKDGEEVKILADTSSINSCKTINDLKELIVSKTKNIHP